MKKLLGFLFALVLASAAHATTYYVVDCQTGANASCAANVGSNGNAGTVSTLPLQTYTQLSLTAGDVVNLANGGAWNIASDYFLAQCLTCTVGNSITFTSFTPTWCTTTCASNPDKPRINITASGVTAFRQTSLTAGKGYAWANLKIVGFGVGNLSTAFYFSSGASDMTFSNLEVTAVAQAWIIYTDRFVIKSNNIHDNGDLGVYGGSVGFLIEGNTFNNNGGGQATVADALRSHNMYLSNEHTGQISGVVRGNTFTKSSLCTISGAACTTPGSGVCVGVNLVVHGKSRGLVIEGNTFDETGNTSASSGGCYAIAVDVGYNEAESFSGTIIRRNKAINTALLVHLSACPSCLVENNIYVSESTSPIPGPIGIWSDVTDAGGLAGGASFNQALTLRNNSFYFGAGGANANCLRLVDQGLLHRVYNNACYFGAGSDVGSYCYYANPFSSFAVFDYNLCFRVGGANIYSFSFSTFASRVGYDAHGSISDPTLTATPAIGNSYDIAFTNGLTKNGGTAPCPGTTYGGFLRTGTCDIGAHQQGASVVVPNSPTVVH